ncbi:transmembrane protein 229B-like [Clupea harengus]|uniref:Transmembrane protein 229B-like n=1 Tax=Clupea harengus TaxID=7950 RepID=A0A6P3VWE5_CLUHA|nr:transmembrane protein 229B-like [Clupea harengus]
MATSNRAWKREGARLTSRDKGDTKVAESSSGRQTPTRRPLPPLARLYIYALHGLFCEVAFTAVFDCCLTFDPRLPGHTSLWALLIYGSAVFVLEDLSLWLNRKRCPLLARMILYTLVTYLWEFTSGFLLRLVGACPWDYSQFQYNFLGLVTLEYAIPWALVSLIAEKLLVPYTLRLRLES